MLPVAIANQQVVQLHEATTTGGGVALPPAGRPAVIDEGANATPVAAVRASSSVLRGTRPSAQGLIPAVCVCVSCPFEYATTRN